LLQQEEALEEMQIISELDLVVKIHPSSLQHEEALGILCVENKICQLLSQGG
jgi:hypothetical protein